MTNDPRVVLRADDIDRALTRVGHEIVERNPDRLPALVGIHRRGARPRTAPARDPR